MTTKTLSLRLPLGLYEQLEREAISRSLSVAQVILERIEKSMEGRLDGCNGGYQGRYHSEPQLTGSRLTDHG